MKEMKLWLLLLTIVCFLPSISLAISVNDGIVTTAALNTRSSPSTGGTLLATIPNSTPGIVVGGSVSADGYIWWQILWSYGSPLVTGWSIQDYLATTPTSSTVYTDYLWPGWHNLAWTNMSSTYTSSTKRSGTYGIQATAAASWARLYMRTTIGFSTSGYQTLRLSLMNPTSANSQQLYIALYNTSGSPIHYVQAHNYVSGGNLTANTWYDLIIPISDLQASSQTIGGVVIEIGVAGTFYIDDVNLSASSGSTYWNPSTITSVSVSCTPTSVQTSSTSQCSATVSGTGSYSSTVSWGASTGSINSSGLFTAPSSVPNPAGIAIVATSFQDPTKYGSATVTVTTGSLSQASSDVFTDAMGTGWYIGGWTQVTTDPVFSISYQGNYGMQVQIATSAWGRVQLKTNSGYKFNTAGKTHLGFAINIGRYEGEYLHVGLLNSGGTVIQYVDISASPYPVLDSHQWKVIFVPLSDLGASNTDIYGVEVQSATAVTIFLDSVKFKGDCSGL